MSSVRTMASWPKLVRDYDEIPALFQNNTIARELKNREFPHMVFIPPFRSGFRRSNAMLIYILDEDLYIIEKDKKQFLTTVFPIKDINFIETGSVLLNSWIKVNGVIDGKPVSKNFEFNTVALVLFEEIVSRIRNASTSSVEGMGYEEEKDKFNFLSHINYKFMTYGRQSLMHDSKVVKMTVQKEITQSERMLWRNRVKTISPSHLSVLTQRELIILRDVDRRYSKYGIIYTYIPLSRLLTASMEAGTEGGSVKVCLSFITNENLNLLFSNEVKGELSMFIESVMQQKNEFLEKVKSVC